jgi:transcriptional regulator with XRE-family HTH domain
MEARYTLLRAAMARGGLSTQAAADLCGVSRRTVQFWLAGKARIPALALEAILAAAHQTPTTAPAKQALATVARDQKRAVAALEAALEAERQALLVTQTQLETLKEE